MIPARFLTAMATTPYIKYGVLAQRASFTKEGYSDSRGIMQHQGQQLDASRKQHTNNDDCVFEFLDHHISREELFPVIPNISESPGLRDEQLPGGSRSQAPTLYHHHGQHCAHQVGDEVERRVDVAAARHMQECP